jgi:hypothetical protein
MLSGKDLIPFSVDVFSVKPFWAYVNLFFIDTYYTLTVLVFFEKA